MAVIAAAGVVVAIGGAIMGGMAQRAAAQAQLIVAKANAEAGNITRAADNEYRGLRPPWLTSSERNRTSESSTRPEISTTP